MAITTVDTAQYQAFPTWAPQDSPVDPTRCIIEVTQQTGLFRSETGQCRGKAGHGQDGAFCAIHARNIAGRLAERERSRQWQNHYESELGQAERGLNHAVKTFIGNRELTSGALDTKNLVAALLALADQQDRGTIVRLALKQAVEVQIG